MASQRYNQTSLEGQSKQADIAVLTAATAPLAPSGPRVMLNTAMALVVGTILGIGAALALELLDQRVRSAAQLTQQFELPVLGVIAKSRIVQHKRSYPTLPHPGDGSPKAAQA
jgi:capsular polysaccharide biosynthesis protein